jgi:hypothetical protein
VSDEPDQKSEGDQEIAVVRNRVPDPAENSPEPRLRRVANLKLHLLLGAGAGAVLHRHGEHAGAGILRLTGQGPVRGQLQPGRQRRAGPAVRRRSDVGLESVAELLAGHRVVDQRHGGDDPWRGRRDAAEAGRPDGQRQFLYFGGTARSVGDLHAHLRWLSLYRCSVDDSVHAECQALRQCAVGDLPGVPAVAALDRQGEVIGLIDDRRRGRGGRDPGRHGGASIALESADDAQQDGHEHQRGDDDQEHVDEAQLDRRVGGVVSPPGRHDWYDHGVNSPWRTAAAV